MADIRRRLVETLQGTGFFGAFPEQAIEAIVVGGYINSFSKGTLIYRRGASGESLMALLSGRVKISNVSPEGKEIILNFLRAGDLIGEIAALDGKGRTADATAIEQTTAFVIPARVLLPQLQSHPTALLEVTRILCAKLRLTSEIVEDSSRDMRERTASGLLRLVRYHGTDNKEAVRLDLALSQQDLGNYLGISRENVSRQLRELRLANVLRLEERHIVITDMAGLKEFAMDIH